jgi:hypothetical protein
MPASVSGRSEISSFRIVIGLLLASRTQFFVGRYIGFLSSLYSFPLYIEHQEICEKLFRGSGLIIGKILASRRERCGFEYASLRCNSK